MSDMWWHSYRTSSEDFSLMTLKHWVRILWDLVLDSSNKSEIVVITASLSSHLQPRSQSVIYLWNIAWLCKANSFGRVLRGGRGALKGSPPAAACPLHLPTQANVRNDPNETGSSLCLLDQQFQQCPCAQTPGNPYKGKLGCASKRGSHPQCS